MLKVSAFLLFPVDKYSLKFITRKILGRGWFVLNSKDTRRGEEEDGVTIAIWVVGRTTSSKTLKIRKMQSTITVMSYKKPPPKNKTKNDISLYKVIHQKG